MWLIIQYNSKNIFKKKWWLMQKMNKTYHENSNNNDNSTNIKHILVCVTQQKNCERLIKKAIEISTPINATISVLHVAKEDFNILDASNNSEALEYLFSVSKSAGANLTVITSDNTIKSIEQYVADNDIDCIILGNSPKDSDNTSFVNQLMDKLSDIHVVLA